jgi:hypothetical protein
MLRPTKLIFPGDEVRGTLYHDKLDKLLLEGTGQINMAHFGGSHIQADMWSMRTAASVPERGAWRERRTWLHLPLQHGEDQQSVVVQPGIHGQMDEQQEPYPCGYCSAGHRGYSVTTTDTLTTLKISFRGEVYSGYQFNRVKVMHGMDSSFTVSAWSKDINVHIA